MEYENLTPYSKAPLFEMMRADITEEEKNKFYNNWKVSLPPSQGLALDVNLN